MANGITLSDSSRVGACQQIAVQIAARILSGEMGAGRRLPSGRAMAQRLRVDRSVVTGAYRRLSGWGLVRTEPGSGVFVAGEPAPDGSADGSLRRFLEARRASGRPLTDTSALLSEWVRAASGSGVLLVERESALGKILAEELSASLPGIPVTRMTLGQVLRCKCTVSGHLVVARRGLVSPLQTVLPPWIEVLPVRFRIPSAELLASAPSRGPSAIALCTRSACLRDFARDLLASTYGDRVGLVPIDPADESEVRRAHRICRWIFADRASSAELLRTIRSTCSGIARVRIMRLIAPRFAADLARYLRPQDESDRSGQGT